MRPIEQVDLGNMEIPEVSTDGNVMVCRELDNGEIEILSNRVDFTAVINEDINETIAIHGKQYKLYSNEEFIQVVKAVTGDRFEGYINNEWNRLDVYYYPRELNINVNGDNNEDTIRIGLRFTNSYDGSSCLRTEFIGQRLVCSNGLILKGLIAGVSTKHTMNSLDPEGFSQTVEEIFAETDLSLLKDIFEQSKEDKITDPIAWVEALAFKTNLPKGLKLSVQEQLLKDKVTEISRYALWNMFTKRITHGYGTGDNIKDNNSYSESYLQRVHSKVNDILTISETQIQEIISELERAEELHDRAEQLVPTVIAEK